MLMNNEYQLIQNSTNDIDEKIVLNQDQLVSYIKENDNVIDKIIQMEISIALMIPILRLFINQKRCKNILTRQTMRNLHQYLIVGLMMMFTVVSMFMNRSLDKTVIELLAMIFIIAHLFVYILENKAIAKGNLLD